MSASILRIFQRIFKFTVRILIYGVETCKYLTCQMWFKNSIQNFLSAANRSRRVVLACLVVLVIILYLWPSRLKFNLRGKQKVTTNYLDRCLAERFENYQEGIQKHDVLLKNPPEDQHQFPDVMPFVGNGKFGVSFDGESKLHIKLNRALILPVQYFPIIDINIQETYEGKEAFATLLKSGIVHRAQCFKKSQSHSCISAGTQVYAHRKRPSLLVQDIRLHNYALETATVDLHFIGSSDWRGASSTTKSVGGKEYILTTGKVKVPSSNDYIFVAIATSKVPETVEVKPGSTLIYHIISTVEYSDIVSEKTAEKIAPSLVQNVSNSLQAALNIDSKKLRQEHTNIWQMLWQTGFSISTSLAPGALNGNKINSTMYYVLSNVRSPIHEVDVTTQAQNELEAQLYFPDRCYSQRHPTLEVQDSGLWGDIKSAADLSKVVTLWIITLEKNGCAKMLQAGADGVIQAMVLSFGALYFHDEHLELGIHPRDLHRDYFGFRRINYGNNTHVNISVILGEDNKAQLYVALDRNDRPYYGCDAGCLDAPVKLSKELTRFPVKQTEPATAILYITADKAHMEELKHVIHVKEIVEAPAHEHHIVALHRHGHHLGGLPTFFWVSVVILIVIFHLFLFKLVANEYCKNNESRVGRTKYSI